MPNKIQIKRSTTASATPTAGQLDAGELAINTADGKLFAKNSAGTVVNLPVRSVQGETIYPGSIGVGHTSTPNARVDVRRTYTYVYLCDSLYLTAAFGPREANDGFCTVTHSWTTAGTGSYWQTDYGSTRTSISHYVSGVGSGTFFTILSSGNVGIGTTTPGVLFHVVSTGDGATEIARFRRQNSGNTDGANLAIYADNTNNVVQLRSDGTHSGSFSFYSGSTERVTIATSGEMAINSNTVLHAGNYLSYVTKTLLVFTPDQGQPPATNAATLDTRNSVLVLDFDAATDESTVFIGCVPTNTVLTSGLKVRIIWTSTAATPSGACVWGVQFERMNTDIDADSFATAATGTTTANGTSGVPNVTEITITTIDSLAAGEFFRLKVYRDADAAGDNMAEDAELIAVAVEVP